jgi:hypothetical protein
MIRSSGTWLTSIRNWSIGAVYFAVAETRKIGVSVVGKNDMYAGEIFIVTVLLQHQGLWGFLAITVP